MREELLDFNHILHADCDDHDAEEAKTAAARELGEAWRRRPCGVCYICEEGTSTCDRFECVECGEPWCMHCETLRNNGYANFNACPRCLTKKFEVIKRAAAQAPEVSRSSTVPHLDGPTGNDAVAAVTSRVATMLREGKAPVAAVMHVRENLGWNLQRANQLVAEQAKLIRKQQPRTAAPEHPAEAAGASPAKGDAAATEPRETPTKADPPTEQVDHQKEKPRTRHRRRAERAAKQHGSAAPRALPAQTPLPEEDAEISSVGLEARYLLMRILRLLMALSSEVALFFSLFLMVRAGFWWLGQRVSGSPDWWQSYTGHWYMDWTVHQAGYAIFFWFAVFIASWCLMYSAGMPFRFSTTMPGLSAKRCRVCRVVTPDYWHCGNCNSFRAEKALSLLLWVASLIVTVIFFLVDVTRFVLTVFLWPRS